jgi:hypothetical protein
MKLPTAVRHLRSRTTRSPAGRLRPNRPVLEVLEARNLLSAAVPASYGQLPLAFEVNQGQAPAAVNYLAHGSGYSVALTAQGAQVNLSQGATNNTLNLQLLGANVSTPAIGQEELITKSNYLVGNDPSKWLTNIANYGQVEYRNVYQGVDAVYSGNQGRLETTFLVQPGASAGAIRMQVQGAQSLALDGQGNLVLHTSGGDVTEQAPVTYQEINGVRQAVSSRYVLEGNNQVGFQVGAYDPSQTLIIDPTLSYSSYLSAAGADYAIAVDNAGNAYIGGSLGIAKLNSTGTALLYSTTLGGSVYGVALDSSGDAYLTGAARSTSFATTANALQPTYPGTRCGFFTVLNPTGSGLLYSTYLPGVLPNYVTGTTQNSYAGNIAVDSSGNAYITASANSSLPTTAGAFQPSYPGGSSSSTACLMEIDPYLSGTASLVYSTFLGGSGGDGGSGVSLDSAGNVYVTGYTHSANFPTTPGAFQTAYGGGGGGDVFVAKLNTALAGPASLIYSTYLGGSGGDGATPDLGFHGSSTSTIGTARGPAITVDSSGAAYVTGNTSSTNFPVTAGAYRTSNPYPNTVAFLSKLDPTGSKLVYSTYLGANYRQKKGTYNATIATGVVVDANGNATITGLTYATDFPTVNPIQSTLGGYSDAFVTTFNAAGSGLLFSTYLGGSLDDWAMGIAEDSTGNVYVAGFTGSSTFPVTPGAYQTSFSGPWTGFVFKIDPPAGGASSPASTAAAPAPSTASRGGADGGSPTTPSRGAAFLPVLLGPAVRPAASSTADTRVVDALFADYAKSEQVQALDLLLAEDGSVNFTAPAAHRH